MDSSLLAPVWLSIQLAGLTTLLLLLLATPLAWWLSYSHSRIKPVVDALVALPLVLPPTVLGFYLLLLFSPDNPFGATWLQLTDETLAFSFQGLVIASMLYSLPFVVQPLQTAFTGVGKPLLEAAATLGASPLDRFFNVAIPLARHGYLTAAILGFAHTIGEFGVVLMVGGNIPGETRVISIAIFEHVETLQYRQAHILSAGLIVFSFLVLLLVYSLNRKHLRLLST